MTTSIWTLIATAALAAAVGGGCSSKAERQSKRNTEVQAAQREMRPAFVVVDPATGIASATLNGGDDVDETIAVSIRSGQALDIVVPAGTFPVGTNLKFEPARPDGWFAIQTTVPPAKEFFLVLEADKLELIYHTGNIDRRAWAALAEDRATRGFALASRMSNYRVGDTSTNRFSGLTHGSETPSSSSNGTCDQATQDVASAQTSYDQALANRDTVKANYDAEVAAESEQRAKLASCNVSLQTRFAGCNSSQGAPLVYPPYIVCSDIECKAESRLEAGGTTSVSAGSGCWTPASNTASEEVEAYNAFFAKLASCQADLAAANASKTKAEGLLAQLPALESAVASASAALDAAKAALAECQAVPPATENPVTPGNEDEGGSGSGHTCPDEAAALAQAQADRDAKYNEVAAMEENLADLNADLLAQNDYLYELLTTTPAVLCGGGSAVRTAYLASDDGVCSIKMNVYLDKVPKNGEPISVDPCAPPELSGPLASCNVTNTAIADLRQDIATNEAQLVTLRSELSTLDASLETAQANLDGCLGNPPEDAGTSKPRPPEEPQPPVVEPPQPMVVEPPRPVEAPVDSLTADCATVGGALGVDNQCYVDGDLVDLSDPDVNAAAFACIGSEVSFAECMASAGRPVRQPEPAPLPRPVPSPVPAPATIPLIPSDAELELREAIDKVLLEPMR